jgi:flagellin-like protein
MRASSEIIASLILILAVIAAITAYMYMLPQMVASPKAAIYISSATLDTGSSYILTLGIGNTGSSSSCLSITEIRYGSSLQSLSKADILGGAASTCVDPQKISTITLVLSNASGYILITAQINTEGSRYVDSFLLIPVSKQMNTITYRAI